MLIYCAYERMDQEGPPDWVEKLRQNPMAQKGQWSIYSPFLSFSENAARDPGLIPKLSDQNRISPAARENAQALRIDPQIFQDPAKVLNRIQASDLSPSIDLPFKLLYVIVRSNFVLVDLNAPGYGEAMAEVLYSYFSNVPVIGICHRFIQNPWMIGRVKSVVFPRTTDEIVRQVLAHGQELDSVIEHHRTQEAEKKNDEPSPSPVSGNPVPSSV